MDLSRPKCNYIYIYMYDIIMMYAQCKSKYIIIIIISFGAGYSSSNNILYIVNFYYLYRHFSYNRINYDIIWCAAWVSDDHDDMDKVQWRGYYNIITPDWRSYPRPKLAKRPEAFKSANREQLNDDVHTSPLLGLCYIYVCILRILSCAHYTIPNNIIS